MIKTTLYNQKLIHKYILLIKKQHETLKVDSNTFETNTSVYLNKLF